MLVYALAQPSHQKVMSPSVADVMMNMDEEKVEKLTGKNHTKWKREVQRCCQGSGFVPELTTPMVELVQQRIQHLHEQVVKQERAQFSFLYEEKPEKAKPKAKRRSDKYGKSVTTKYATPEARVPADTAGAFFGTPTWNETLGSNRQRSRKPKASARSYASYAQAVSSDSDETIEYSQSSGDEKSDLQREIEKEEAIMRKESLRTFIKWKRNKDLVLEKIEDKIVDETARRKQDLFIKLRATLKGEKKVLIRDLTDPQEAFEKLCEYHSNMLDLSTLNDAEEAYFEVKAKKYATMKEFTTAFLEKRQEYLEQGGAETELAGRSRLVSSLPYKWFESQIDEFGESKVLGNNTIERVVQILEKKAGKLQKNDADYALSTAKRNNHANIAEGGQNPKKSRDDGGWRKARGNGSNSSAQQPCPHCRNDFAYHKPDQCFDHPQKGAANLKRFKEMREAKKLKREAANLTIGNTVNSDKTELSKMAAEIEVLKAQLENSKPQAHMAEDKRQDNNDSFELDLALLQGEVLMVTSHAEAEALEDASDGDDRDACDLDILDTCDESLHDEDGHDGTWKEKKHELKPSTVSGLTAVAGEDVADGEIITTYEGVLLTENELRDEYYERTMKYVVELEAEEKSDDERLFLDASDPDTSNWARKIESPGPGQGRGNCHLVQKDGQLLVVATENIKEGEPYLMDYGCYYRWPSGTRLDVVIKDPDEEDEFVMAMVEIARSGEKAAGATPSEESQAHMAAPNWLASPDDGKHDTHDETSDDAFALDLEVLEPTDGGHGMHSEPHAASGDDNSVCSEPHDTSSGADNDSEDGGINDSDVDEDDDSDVGDDDGDGNEGDTDSDDEDTSGDGRNDGMVTTRTPVATAAMVPVMTVPATVAPTTTPVAATTVATARKATMESLTPAWTVPTTETSFKKEATAMESPTRLPATPTGGNARHCARGLTTRGASSDVSSGQEATPTAREPRERSGDGSNAQSSLL
jgi:hypothetical protein